MDPDPDFTLKQVSQTLLADKLDINTDLLNLPPKKQELPNSCTDSGPMVSEGTK